MNQTTNYNLNQWQRHDRVLMDDFNADNAKIDAALKAEADARAAADNAEASARVAGDLCVKLLEQTLSKDAAQMDISLSGIDLSKYRQLDLWVEPTLTANGANTICLRVNGLTTGYRLENASAGWLGQAYVGTDQSKFCYACFHIYFTKNLACKGDYAYLTDSGISSSHSDRLYGIELAPTDLKTLNLAGWKSGYYNVLKGTKVYLYGWKK